MENYRCYQQRCYFYFNPQRQLDPPLFSSDVTDVTANRHILKSLREGIDRILLVQQYSTRRLPEFGKIRIIEISTPSTRDPTPGKPK